MRRAWLRFKCAVWSYLTERAHRHYVSMRDRLFMVQIKLGRYDEALDMMPPARKEALQKEFERMMDELPDNHLVEPEHTWN